MVDPKNDLKNCADRADRGSRPANILRDLHNSSGDAKNESNNFFLSFDTNFSSFSLAESPLNVACK